MPKTFEQIAKDRGAERAILTVERHPIYASVQPPVCKVSQKVGRAELQPNGDRMYYFRNQVLIRRAGSDWLHSDKGRWIVLFES